MAIPCIAVIVARAARDLDHRIIGNCDLQVVTGIGKIGGQRRQPVGIVELQRLAGAIAESYDSS